MADTGQLHTVGDKLTEGSLLEVLLAFCLLLCPQFLKQCRHTEGI